MKRCCQRQTQVLDVPGPAHDLVGADAVGAQKHNFRSPSVLLRGVTVLGDRFKLTAI
jgi:hypothetical protein